ncbi:MAG: PilW family protein [Nitrosomonadales bacterium]|nr:PilW family protein [Nitrosomonadales bacterium]
MTKLKNISHQPFKKSFGLNCSHPNTRRHASGFSLVEIMVGMVIGMLGIIVIMQVFALFEGQKRTTSGGAEAQNTGIIALSSLTDDIRQSGYGFNLINLIGCDVLLRTGVTIQAMAPTTINSPSVTTGDFNTDTLLMVYGNSDILPEGNSIVAPAIDSTHFSVQAFSSFLVGDYVIATPQNRSCSPANPAILNQVTTVTNPTLTLTPGVTPSTSVTPGMLFNLGQAITIHAYAIRNGSLTMCDYMVNNCGDNSKVTPTLDSSVWVPIAGNIVSLRAQYGQDISNHAPTITSAKTGSMDGIVDIYSQTSPGNTGVTENACGWLRTLNIRLALVARNGQFEKSDVTSNAPVWEGSTATNNDPAWVAAGGSVTGASANPIDLTKNPDGTTQNPPDQWEHYRYKVFQTTVPIRNITSSVALGKASGC